MGMPSSGVVSGRSQPGMANPIYLSHSGTPRPADLHPSQASCQLVLVGSNLVSIDPQLGFQIIYQLGVTCAGNRGTISELGVHRRCPETRRSLIRCSTSFDHPRLARPGGLCMGHCNRRDRLERSLSSVFPTFRRRRWPAARIFQADRTGALIRSDALTGSPCARFSGALYRIDMACGQFIRALLWIEESGCGSPAPTASRPGCRHRPTRQ